jgi:uncharacterized protein (DUF3820 family)
MYYTRMPWGKHEGKRLEDVPLSYLRWVLRQCDAIPLGLRRAIRDVVLEAEDSGTDVRGSREADSAGPPVNWPGVLRDWYRGLAMDYHPDRGGSVEVMKAINEAHDRLRKLVGI